ncbi:RCC1 domain-containing protein [Rubeoparvulum massiliense]|uniref:RCC1 domain-containing protein n=1 Tax=Rubeoparvulum massiliense TaxID=1631346 RepID=UPI00065E17A5|nr:hypothetical protein [Rubeoparvulum massiliense]
MTKKKYAILLLVLLMAITMLNACTTSEEKESQNNSPPSATSPSPSDGVVDSNEPVSFTLEASEPIQATEIDSSTIFELMPSEAKNPLTNIQGIAVGSLIDEAGYGYQFGSSYALSQDGKVYAWGYRHWEEEKHAAFPVEVQGLPRISQIAGEFAVTQSGEVWFLNPLKQPMIIKDLTGITRIIQGAGDSVIALKQDGTVSAWGRYSDGDKLHTLEVKAVRDIFASTLHGNTLLFLITSDEQLWEVHLSYGMEDSLPPKLITLPNGEKPLQVAGLLDGYQAFIYTTAGNWYLYNMEKEFTKLNIPNDFIKIAGTSYTQLGLKQDGTVWAWHTTDGINNALLPEEYATATMEKPRQIKEIPAITDIQVGSDHALALTKDGKVYSWGSNMYGQLGQKPYYFDQFTPFGRFKQGNVDAVLSPYQYIIAGDVWHIGNLHGLEPILLDQHVKSAALYRDPAAFLTDAGVILEWKQYLEGNVLTKQYKKLHSTVPITQMVNTTDGLLTLLETGSVMEIVFDNQDIRNTRQVKMDPTPRGRIVQLYNYPIPIVLTDEGEVYYQSTVTEQELVMNPIPNLPKVTSWGPLNHLYFELMGPIAKIIDAQGNAYTVEMEKIYAPNGNQGNTQGNSNQTNNPKIQFTITKTGENAVMLTGGLVIFQDGTIREELNGWPNIHVSGHIQQDPIKHLSSYYAYYIEGPGSLAHVIVQQDGTLLWLGHHPFSRMANPPGPVVQN